MCRRTMPASSTASLKPLKTGRKARTVTLPASVSFTDAANLDQVYRAIAGKGAEEFERQRLGTWPAAKRGDNCAEPLLDVCPRCSKMVAKAEMRTYPVMMKDQFPVEPSAVCSGCARQLEKLPYYEDLGRWPAPDPLAERCAGVTVT